MKSPLASLLHWTPDPLRDTHLQSCLGQLFHARLQAVWRLLQQRQHQADARLDGAECHHIGISLTIGQHNHTLLTARAAPHWHALRHGALQCLQQALVDRTIARTCHHQALNPAATSASTASDRASAVLVTISTHGHWAAGLSQTAAGRACFTVRACGCSSEAQRTRPSSTQPAGPCAPEANALTR